MLNTIDFLSFGFSLYKKGVCDNRIEGEYSLIQKNGLKGYTKKEAAEVLNLSVRQFDRKIKQGDIVKGKKYRNVTHLFWDKEYIDNLSKKI